MNRGEPVSLLIGAHTKEINAARFDRPASRMGPSHSRRTGSVSTAGAPKTTGCTTTVRSEKTCKPYAEYAQEGRSTTASLHGTRRFLFGMSGSGSAGRGVRLSALRAHGRSMTGCRSQRGASAVRPRGWSVDSATPLGLKTGRSRSNSPRLDTSPTIASIKERKLTPRDKGGSGKHGMEVAGA